MSLYILSTVRTKVHVVRNTHTLQCRAMPCTETKLTCIKQISHLSVTCDLFGITFSKSLPVVINFEEIFGP
jgi:hypothetical protein